MSKLGFSNSFSGMLDCVLSTPITPRLAPLQSLDASAAVEGDVFLPVAAESDDRQEARRRIIRGGTLLRDDGVDSDDGHMEQPQQLQQQQLRKQSLLSMFSSSGSVSSPTSISGGPGQDQASPSERYWRDRASLMGGRCSLEAHAAKLKERRQVQAELRAWVDEVLQGQQQQQQDKEQNSEEDTLQQQRHQQQSMMHTNTQSATTQANNRWSDLPAELYYQLTGHQLPASAAASPASTSTSKHHRHHRHSMRARKSGRATQLMCEQQQQQLGALSEQTYSSVHSSDGLHMTPRTAQEFGDSLRQQFEEQLRMQVQAQLQQAAHQWQQANLADQQLVQKLQEEHQALQQQLRMAQQQITILQARTSTAQPSAKHASSNASVATNDAAAKQSLAESSGPTGGDQRTTYDVLSSPAPNVQVLTLLTADEEMVLPGSEVHCEPAAAGQVGCQSSTDWASSTPDVSQTHSQQYAGHDRRQWQEPSGVKQQQRQTDETVSVTDATARVSPGSTTSQTTTAAAVVADTGSKGGSSSSSSTARSRRTTGTAKATSSSTASQQSVAKKGSNRKPPPGRPGSSVSSDSRLMNLQQQQALIKRLQHAEGVMTVLQQDLQASLAAQQQMAEQLQDAQLQLQQRTVQADQQSQPQQLPGDQEQLMCSEDHLHQYKQQAGQLQPAGRVQQQLATRVGQSIRLHSDKIAAAVEDVQSSRELLMPTSPLQAAGSIPNDELGVAANSDEGINVTGATGVLTAADAKEKTCLHCTELQKVIQELSYQLQQAGVPQATHLPWRTSSDAVAAVGPRQRNVGCDMTEFRNGSDLGCHQHRPARQVAPIAVVTCPHAPAVPVCSAAAEDAVNVAAWSPADPASLSVTQAINIGLLSLAAIAKDNTAAGRYCSACRAPDSVMLPGICRMRPMTARSHSDVGGVVGVALGSSRGQMQITTPPLSQPETAAVFFRLLQESRAGLQSPATAPHTFEAVQTTQACAVAENGLMLSSRQARSPCVVSGDGARPSSAVCFRVRSASPRPHSQTARSAVSSATGGSGVLPCQTVHSPRRPRTAASIPSKHLAVGLEVRAGLSEQLGPSTGDSGSPSGVADCKASMPFDNGRRPSSPAPPLSASLVGKCKDASSAVPYPHSRALRRPQHVPLLNLAKMESGD